MDLILIAAVAFFVWIFIRGTQAQGSNGGDGVQIETPPSTGESVSDYDPFTELAQAWANAEGWNKPGSLAQRNLNPVNLKGSWPAQTGSTPQGFAVFSSDTDGFNAAQAYLKKQAAQHPNWTLKQLFAEILGNLDGTPVNNAQGNSDQEAANVASYLGISADTTLEDFMGVS